MTIFWPKTKRCSYISDLRQLLYCSTVLCRVSVIIQGMSFELREYYCRKVQFPFVTNLWRECHKRWLIDSRASCARRCVKWLWDEMDCDGTLLRRSNLTENPSTTQLFNCPPGSVLHSSIDFLIMKLLHVQSDKKKIRWRKLQQKKIR